MVSRENHRHSSSRDLIGLKVCRIKQPPHEGRHQIDILYINVSQPCGGCQTRGYHKTYCLPCAVEGFRPQIGAAIA